MALRKVSGIFHQITEKLYFVSDPMKIYSFSYWLYVWTGFWKYDSPMLYKKLLYKIYQLILALSYTMAVSFLLIDAVRVRRDLVKLSFNLSNTFLALVTFAKVSFLAMKKESLEMVNEELENHLRVGTIGDFRDDRLIFRKRAVQLCEITKILYALLVSIVFMTLLTDAVLQFYHIPMPFEGTSRYHLEIMLVQQLIIPHFITTVICHDMFIYTFIVRFLAHFEVLEKNILLIRRLYPGADLEESEKSSPEEIQNPPGKYPYDRSSLLSPIKDRKVREMKTNQLLKEIIAHHQVLLKQINEFDRVYSLPFMVQALGGGFHIGVIILQIIILSSQITILFVQQVLNAIITLVNVLQMCSFGTEIMTRSMAAADALYETPWYEMDEKNMKIVSFIMKKLIEAPKLRGGSVIVINKITYLKVSYNFIAVLQNIY